MELSATVLDNGSGRCSRREAEVSSWFSYYGAGNFITSSAWEQPGHDEAFSDLLGCDLAALVDSGVGTSCTMVHGIEPDRSSPDDLEDINVWFAHGDPWHVLIGFGTERLVVGSVDLFEGGYAGPPALTCIRPQSIARDAIDLAALETLMVTARRDTIRSMTRCKLCDSPRYGPGCRCDGPATNTIYD